MHRKNMKRTYTAAHLAPWTGGAEGGVGAETPEPITNYISSDSNSKICVLNLHCFKKDCLHRDRWSDHWPQRIRPCIYSTLSNHLYIVTHFITRVLYVFSAQNDSLTDNILYYMSIKIMIFDVGLTNLGFTHFACNSYWNKQYFNL